MKKTSLLLGLLLLTTLAWTQTPKIKAYFTRAVNNSVSTGTNAVFLDNLVDDTLIAYINRAQFTIDAAIYSFKETNDISSIAAAINSAYARGVAVRWIYDGSSSNPSLSLLNSNIPTLASPTSEFYGIMHNKFMIIDANSTNVNDPIVWTGSCNFSASQINTDANNILIIQDKAIAAAYLTEFNEMWGDEGLVPNTGDSKFGPFKTNNTPHNFVVDGVPIELYFSPTDGTNAKLQNAMGSSDIDMYFGVYSFTVSADADTIVKQIEDGVYVAGILDPTSSSYPPYAILSPIMGENLIKDNITGLYHNKMLIVDPSAPNSDPLVLTGSHNWSASADTKNDENTLIIHDATLANIYYQSFFQNFTDEGGTLVLQTGIESLAVPSSFLVYPNPCKNEVFIKLENNKPIKNVSLFLTDALGRTLYKNEMDSYGLQTIHIQNLQTGLYFICIQDAKTSVTKKLQVVR